MRVSIWAIVLICPILACLVWLGACQSSWGAASQGFHSPIGAEATTRDDRFWMGLPTEPAYRVFMPVLQQGGANVRSWVYQLSSYQNNRLDQIAGSSFDLAVVDLARDGGGDYFTPGEVAALTSRGKLALAYFRDRRHRGLSAGVVTGAGGSQVGAGGGLALRAVREVLGRALVADCPGAGGSGDRGRFRWGVSRYGRDLRGDPRQCGRHQPGGSRRQDGRPDRTDLAVCQGRGARLQDRAAEQP